MGFGICQLIASALHNHAPSILKRGGEAERSVKRPHAISTQLLESASLASSCHHLQIPVNCISCFVVSVSCTLAHYRSLFLPFCSSVTLHTIRCIQADVLPRRAVLNIIAAPFRKRSHHSTYNAAYNATPSVVVCNIKLHPQKASRLSLDRSARAQRAL